MPFTILRGDITQRPVDAIVNAANASLVAGGGVCGVIFRAAGAAKLQAACDAIGGCMPGQAVITPGFALPAKYIIHTPGPIWRKGTGDQPALLRACYTNALKLALEHKCASIAFPLLSSGLYGCPKDEALSIAISAIGDFLLENDEIRVELVVFDRESYRCSKKLFSAVSSYIDDAYAEARSDAMLRKQELEAFACNSTALEDNAPCVDAPHDAEQDAPRSQRPFLMPSLSLPLKPRTPERPPAAQNRRLENMLAEMEETFSERVLRLIDAQGRTDAEIYKRANIDRRLFSKLRGDPKYRPSKNTAIALALALELNLDETRDLLRKAGFALSRSSRFDIIIEYFITKRIYNIFEINEVLFAFDAPLLGG